jgi:hypothetical protein
MTEILTHEQVLEILSEQARDGSVTAACALERALRRQEEGDDTPEDELEALISTK